MFQSRFIPQALTGKGHQLTVADQVSFKESFLSFGHIPQDFSDLVQQSRKADFHPFQSCKSGKFLARRCVCHVGRTCNPFEPNERVSALFQQGAIMNYSIYKFVVTMHLMKLFKEPSLSPKITISASGSSGPKRIRPMIMARASSSPMMVSAPLTLT